MKDLFPEFYRPSDQEFKEIWKRATFVFDSNVLLDLYRYRTSTKDALLTVIEKISDRVWIPFHVALEFQRNRLKQIKDQKTKFSDVKRAIGKAFSGLNTDINNLQLEKRHSLIDPKPFLEEIQNANVKFSETLDAMVKKCLDINADDPIRNKLDGIFAGKVGDPPSQALVESISKEGSERYECEIPPGYKDANKDETFRHRNIIYYCKYGDLFLWRQMLEYVKAKNIKDVILVTGDNKEDWMQYIGSNPVGPRAELIEEFLRETGADSFYIYTTERFLEFAKANVDVGVEDDVLDEVRSVSSERDTGKLQDKIGNLSSLHSIVKSWLRKESLVANNDGSGEFDALVVDGAGSLYGLAIYDCQMDEKNVILANAIDAHLYTVFLAMVEGLISVIVSTESEVDNVISKVNSFSNKFDDLQHFVVGIIVDRPAGPQFVRRFGSLPQGFVSK